MANFGRVKTWGNETLQAADLNAEFDNIINNVTSGSVSSANIDLTDGYAWTGAHTFSVDMKVLNGAGLIVGNTAQVTTSSAGELQVLGTAAADSTAIIGHWAAAASGGTLSFVKSRNATIGSSTIVQDNDVLGTIEFMADDGSDFATPAASIFSRVNGTPGANDMPGELVLAVTADSGNSVTERVRVLQNGTVELNSATLSFDAAASIDTSGNNNLGISAGTADVQITASNLTPASNDGSALGVSGTAWSDLFLASGAVANWNAGDITLTHSAGKLTFGGDGAVELDFNNHEMTNVDIDSGAIDGTIIGAASAAAGSFAAIVGTSLDINGAADISGDLTLSAGADGALTFANAGENSIKIPDNQASALIVEEANNAYLTFVTTNSGEKITLGKKLEAGSVEIEGSAFDINGGNIDGATIGAASAAAGTFTTITGSGDVAIDTDTLFVDVSEDRVGIGTASPSYGVHYTQAITASGNTSTYGTMWLQDFTASSSGTASHQGHVFAAYKVGDNNFTSDPLPGLSALVAIVDDKSGATGTVTHAAAIQVFNGSMPGGAAFTSKSGVYVAEQTGGTNNYGIYALGNSHFGGNVGIATAAPDEMLHLKKASPKLKIHDTDGGTGQGILEFLRESASPADGDGVGMIEFRGETDSGAETGYGYIKAISTDVSNSTVGSSFKFATRSGGAWTEENLVLKEGNVGVGTDVFGSSAANVLAIANGTAPGTSADKAQLYVVSGELIVKDGAGNATTLSPHNFGDGKPSEEMAWSYHSRRGNKSISVDMLRVVRLLEELTGEKLAHIEEAA